MERNRWETAIRCLEVAVHPHTRDDEVVAAINGFRRTVAGVAVSQVCIEFACGGLPLAELANMKATMERLDRENRELRRKLAAEETARQEAAQRLDGAYRRIYELTEEAAAAERLAEALGREFEDFRAAYAIRDEGDATDRRIATLAAGPWRSFSAFLAEARLGADDAASFADTGTGSGSGRKVVVDPSWSA